jgi:hypothetical protein
MQTNARTVYEGWAHEHADGIFLTERPYDASAADLDISVVRLEPQPNLGIARKMGIPVMGKASYDELSVGLQDVRAIETAKERASKGLNTLVATLHINNVFDTAMTHNNMFVTAGGDENSGNKELAAINDLVLNPMLGRLNVGTMAVYDALVLSGGLDLLLPIQAARDRGMNRRTISYLGRRMIGAFNARLDEGVVCHWALSGTRGKSIQLKNSDEATMVESVSKNVADLVVERINHVIPVPMVMELGKTAVEVLEPRTVRKVKDVHNLMGEMVETASAISGRKIVYGLPRGAHRL